MARAFPNSDETRRFIADHFRRRRVSLTEAGILGAIEAARSKHDVYWGVLALRDVGTVRSVAVLKRLLHYPMQDVKDCSILTIAHIAGASETPFYLEALADKRTKKAYPMWAIEVAADERAEPVVIAFVKAALRRAARASSSDPGNAYLSGLKYLARLGPDRQGIQTMAELLCAAWPNLPEAHRAVLRGVLPLQLIPE